MDRNEDRNKEALLNEDVNITDDYEDVLCGIGSFRPAFLQPCAKITSFVGFISIAGFLSSCLSVYISSQITTLERMFGFSSSTSGVIMACNDIGYLLSILTASYFARRTHIPRVLYLATTIYGVSGLMCCIPYFLTSEKFKLGSMAPPQSSSGNTSVSMSTSTPTSLCSQNETVFDMITIDTCSENTSGGKSASLFGLTEYESTLAVALIAIGMIIQGFAKAPRHPFINTYIDDNSKKSRSPKYIGTVIGIAIFGPAVAFAIGGFFSRIYVTLEASDMNYRDPKWIGAWWLGFLVFGAAAILFATPLCFYPKHLLPKSQRLSAKESGEKQSVKLKDFKGLLKTIGRLITNPVFFPLVIAQVAHHISIGGSIAFQAKYIETQFYVPVWKANLIMGGCGVLAASTGAFLGGRIISRFKLSPKACMKMMVILHTFHVSLHVAFFLLGCPQQDIKADWNTIGVQYGSMLNDTSCLDNCFCDTLPFRPVCDMNMGITYYSPCHAGCSTRNGTVFSDCACVPSGEVLSGYCPTQCDMLTPFIVVMVLSSLSGATTIMNFLVILMRSVSEADKPLALGLSSFLSNLFGWMPAPIFFGAMIDTSCLIWNTKCDKVGSCAMYDGQDFRYKLNGLIMGVRAFSLMLKYIVLRNIIKTNFFNKRKTDRKTGKELLNINNSLQEKEHKNTGKGGDDQFPENSRYPVDIRNYEMEILLDEKENTSDKKHADSSKEPQLDEMSPNTTDEQNNTTTSENTNIVAESECHAAVPTHGIKTKLMYNEKDGDH